MFLLVAIAALSTGSIDVSRVLVIENTNSDASVEIATKYLEARGIVRELAQGSVPRLRPRCRQGNPAIRNLPNRHRDPRFCGYLKTHPKIDFIVLTKGIPIRLTGAPTGVNGNQPSLDSTIVRRWTMQTATTPS